MRQKFVENAGLKTGRFLAEGAGSSVQPALQGEGAGPFLQKEGFVTDPIVVNINVSGTSQGTLEFTLDGSPEGVTITPPRTIEFTPTPPMNSGGTTYHVTFALTSEGVSYEDPALEFNSIGISPDTPTSVTMINVNDIPPDGEPEIIAFDMRLRVPGQNGAPVLSVIIDDPTIVNNPCGGTPGLS